MLQKVGRKPSTSRQMSAKNILEFKKRHTEGDLEQLKSQIAQRRSRPSRERIDSNPMSSPSPTKSPSPP